MRSLIRDTNSIYTEFALPRGEKDQAVTKNTIEIELMPETQYFFKVLIPFDMKDQLEQVTRLEPV